MICKERNEPWNREWSHFSDTSPSLQLGKIRLWASNEKSNLRSMIKTQNDWEKGHSVYLRALTICQNSVARSKRASFAELRELRMSKLFFIAEGKFGKKQFSVLQHWYVAFCKICAFVRDWRWMLPPVIHLTEVVFDQGTGIFYEVGGAGGIFLKCH